MYSPSQSGSNSQTANQGLHIREGQQDNYAYPGQHESGVAGTETHLRPGIMPTGANSRSQFNVTGVVESSATNTAHTGGVVDSHNPGYHEDVAPPPFQDAVADGRAPNLPQSHSNKGP